jgi:hypothetical protein
MRDLVGVFKSDKFDIHAWLAFLLGVVICVLAMSYAEMRKDPSGLLTFEAASTQPGILKVVLTSDGKLTDPGWAVNFPQANNSYIGSFPLRNGYYELIGFKPLVEEGGRVTIKNLKIISGTGIRNISEGNFVTINQLEKISVSCQYRRNGDRLHVAPNLTLAKLLFGFNLI